MDVQHVWAGEFRQQVVVWGLGLGLSVWGLGLRICGLGIGGLVFGLYGLEFRV